jgi:HK97 family phage prohead protease
VIAGLFRERISPGAFRDTIANDDIRASFNHNLDRILGRKSAGTATFSEDSKGLRYSVKVNEDDPNARSVAAMIARRDVAGSSFWFEPLSHDDEEWEPGGKNELPLRTLKRVRLIEAGPVAMPAYKQTSVTVADVRAREQMLRLRETLALRIRLEKQKDWVPPSLRARV